MSCMTSRLISKKSLILSLGCLLIVATGFAAHKALKRYAQKRVNDALTALDPESESLAIKFESVDYSIWNQSVVLKNVSIVHEQTMSTKMAAVEFKNCRQFKFSLPVNCEVILHEPSFDFDREEDEMTIDDLVDGSLEISEISQEQKASLLMTMILDTLERDQLSTKIKKVTTRTTYKESEDHRLTVLVDVEGDDSVNYKANLDISGISAEKFSRLASISKEIKKKPAAEQMQYAMGSLFEMIAMINDLKIHNIELKSKTQPEWIQSIFTGFSRYNQLMAGQPVDWHTTSQENYKNIAEVTNLTLANIGLPPKDKETLTNFIASPNAFEFSLKPSTPIRVGSIIQQKMMGGLKSENQNQDADFKLSDIKIKLNNIELGISNI